MCTFALSFSGTDGRQKLARKFSSAEEKEKSLGRDAQKPQRRQKRESTMFN